LLKYIEDLLKVSVVAKNENKLSSMYKMWY